MQNPYASPQGEIINPDTPFTPLTWKQILFSFQSRIPRRQYWAALGIQMLIGFAIGFLAFFLLPGIFGDRVDSSDIGTGGVLFGILMIPVVVFLIWTGFAVGVKRCHDRGKSGWWMLVGIIPYIGGLWQLIELGCLRGTEGPNRFGGDPT